MTKSYAFVWACPEAYRISPDDPLPIDYYIDWIRLYQKDGEETIKP